MRASGGGAVADVLGTPRVSPILVLRRRRQANSQHHNRCHRKSHSCSHGSILRPAVPRLQEKDLETIFFIPFSDTMADMENKPRYQAMLDKLRISLNDESDCHYLLHTPFGEIKVNQVVHRFPGFVAVQGQDEAKKERFFVFSEETIWSFPLEVRWRGDSKGDSKGRVGFHLLPDTSTEAQS